MAEAPPVATVVSCKRLEGKIFFEVVVQDPCLILRVADIYRIYEVQCADQSFAECEPGSGVRL